jgi:hypothetical protein
MPRRRRKTPEEHAATIRAMLAEAAQHCRKDVRDVRDKRAKILFETTAEVLEGLENEFEHYEQGRVGVPFLNRLIDSMEGIVETLRPARARRGRRGSSARARQVPQPSAVEVAGAGIGMARSLWRAQRGRRR